MNKPATHKRMSLQHLEPCDVNFYRDQGYLIVKSVLPEEMLKNLAFEAEQIASDHSGLIDSKNMRVRFTSDVNTGERLFDVLDPFADLSPAARAVTQWPAILRILHDLYGEPAKLFKDKFIYKRPGAAGASLHQDWIAWPGFPESFITVVVAVDEFTDGSGATMVYPGQHKRGYLSVNDGQYHGLAPDLLDSQPVLLELEPGDIALFGGFTPHISSPNRSLTSRRGYFISYNAVSDGGDQYCSHYVEFHGWIRAKAPLDVRDKIYFR